MLKRISSHNSLADGIAENHAFGLVQEFRAVIIDFSWLDISIRFANHLLQARVVVGVSGKNTMVTARLASFLLRGFDIEQLLIFKHGNDFDHCLRIVTASRKILRAQTVRLQFVAAAVA